MTDAAAFFAYKTRPDADSLVAILRAHQERIFRLCYQVLHNLHDAEDAAQETLLKIPGEIGRFDDPAPLRRWINRVSLNAALEAARKAGRRRDHESRSVMQKPAPAPLDVATRLSLFEALAALDEESRDTVLEHYFEGASLEAIGEREGCSAPAVHKRLEKARESLRRRLGGTLALPSLDVLFPATPPAPDLVTGAVLAKVAAVAGGTIMATKVVVGMSVAIALACLVGGGVLGAALKGRSDRAKVEGLERRLFAAEKKVEVAPVHDAAPLAPIAEPVRDMSPKEAVASKLREKLARYRTWIEAYYKEYDELGKSDPGNLEKFRARKQAELGELLVGIKDLTCASPGEFLEFVRDPKNEAYLSSLILRGLGFKLNDTVHHGQDFRVFPRELHEGMQDLLMTGSLRQKTAMLEYFALIWNQPAEFKAVYPQFLSEPDTWFQVQVVRTIAQSYSWTDEAFAAVTRLGNSTDNSDVRGAIGTAMMWHQGPKSLLYLLDRLEATRDTQEVISVGQTLSAKISNTYQRKPPPAEIEDQIVRAVTSALGKGYDGATHLVVIRAAVGLSDEKLKPILQLALAQAPTHHSRKTIEDMIQLVNTGQFSAEDLRRTSWGEKNN